MKSFIIIFYKSMGNKALTRILSYDDKALVQDTRDGLYYWQTYDKDKKVIRSIEVLVKEKESVDLDLLKQATKLTAIYKHPKCEISIVGDWDGCKLSNARHYNSLGKFGDL
jgi:hypothetical protein